MTSDAFADETFLTDREVAVARVAARLRTQTGVPMAEVAEAVTDDLEWVETPLTGREAAQYRHRFKEKVIKAGTTLLYASYGVLEAEDRDEILAENVDAVWALLEVERSMVPYRDAEAIESCPNCGSDMNE